MVEDRKDKMNVYFRDDTRFSVYVENCGNWFICEV